MFFTTTEAALTGASPGSETLPVSVARKSWASAGPHSKTTSGRLLIALHNNRLPILPAGPKPVVGCWLLVVGRACPGTSGQQLTTNNQQLVLHYPLRSRASPASRYTSSRIIRSVASFRYSSSASLICWYSGQSVLSTNDCGTRTITVVYRCRL